MYTALVIFDVLLAIALTALVLLQQGKGADAGAAFGSGSAGTVFGAAGSASLLQKATTWLAAGFFVVTLGLSVLAKERVNEAAKRTGSTSVVESIQPDRQPQQPLVPVADSIPEAGLKPTGIDAIPLEESAPQLTVPDIPAEGEENSNRPAADNPVPVE